mgnify:CR=1 FL=1
MNLSQRKIIFLHNPKTAGTSLRTVVFSNYAKQHRSECYGSVYEVVKNRFSQALNEDKCLIYGHLKTQMLNEFELAKNYEWLTFLRNPVEHTVSKFLHFKNAKNTLSGQKERGWITFEEFLETDLAFNAQSQFLGGVRGLTAETANTVTLKKDALDTLHNRIAFCGITEYFEDSVWLMCRQLNWPKTSYKRLNRGKSPGEAAELITTYRTQIEALNQLDMDLYEDARIAFEKMQRGAKSYLTYVKCKQKIKDTLVKLRYPNAGQ